MLQVEKKRKKRLRKWVPWSAVLVIAVGMGLFAFFTLQKKEEMPVRADTRGVLMEHQAEEISRMQVQVRGQEAWTASRNADGSMMIEGDDGWTLDAALGERIEDALAHLVYEDILTEDPAEYADRLADFGLMAKFFPVEAEKPVLPPLFSPFKDLSGVPATTSTSAF